MSACQMVRIRIRAQVIRHPVRSFYCESPSLQIAKLINIVKQVEPDQISSYSTSDLDTNRLKW